jgi:hypothetical protein
MKGYRTIIFNVLMAIAAVTNSIWNTGFTDEQLGVAADGLNQLILMAIVLGNIGLRFTTTGPVGKK